VALRQVRNVPHAAGLGRVRHIFHPLRQVAQADGVRIAFGVCRIGGRLAAAPVVRADDAREANLMVTIILRLIFRHEPEIQERLFC
jgi:hypothetical protein